MASLHTDKKQYRCMVPTLTSINLTNTHIYGVPVLGHPLIDNTGHVYTGCFPQVCRNPNVVVE